MKNGRRIAPAARADWPGFASGAILALGTLAVYGRTFSVPLLYDDSHSIAENVTIRHLWPIWRALSPPNEAGVGGRPLLNLSYALNYAFGGTAGAGYHAVNLVIHILAGLTLFGIVRRTLGWSASRSPPEPGEGGLPTRLGGCEAEEQAGDHALDPTFLALAVSAIWAWHPVQTESVAYLSQRAESLMGLFYLLTLYCFIRHAEAAGSAKAGQLPLQASRAKAWRLPLQGSSGTRQRFVAGWAVLSTLACLLGMATKEVMVSAPVMVFLYDRTFVSGSFSAAWRRHGPLYWALAATWLPLGCLMLGLHQRGVGFGEGVSGWAYGLTECRVLVKYLLLAFWPAPLVFDYGSSVMAARLSEVWPSALALATLLVITGWALLRRPAERGAVRLQSPQSRRRLRRLPRRSSRPASEDGRPLGFGGEALGFAGAWFFLILAPSSSFVPVAGQPMAENRLYLPLAGLIAFAVLGTFALVGRRSLPVFAVVAAVLGLASVRRNRDYSSAQTLWSDTVAKVPANPRAHNNLGNAWSNLPGHSDEAIVQFREALRLDPDLAEAHNNLGEAWLRKPGLMNEAIAQFQEALRLKPDYPEAHNNLGRAWAARGGPMDEAIAQFQEALRLAPNLAEAHNNLGNAWLNQPGRLDEAIAQLQEALRLKGDYPEAHNNLGNAWLKTPGRINDAIAEYEQALRLKPDLAGTHFNLALALLRLPGHGAEAAAQLEAFLQFQPGNGPARQLLARIRASQP